jgi:hypothetical protein
MISQLKVSDELVFNWLWIILLPWLNNTIVYIGFDLELVVNAKICGLRVKQDNDEFS